MSKKYIVEGYKGIMDLDLTNIPKIHHTEMVRKHHEEIEEYKMEQEKLPERLRYDNVVLKAQKLHENDAKEQRIRAEKEKIEWFEKRRR